MILIREMLLMYFPTYSVNPSALPHISLHRIIMNDSQVHVPTFIIFFLSYNPYQQKGLSLQLFDDLIVASKRAWKYRGFFYSFC